MVKSLEERDELRKALKTLYEAVPALGHHEVPDYDCPARELAQAMNNAATLLGFSKPYPQISEKPIPKCDSYWDGNQCEVAQGHEDRHYFMGWTWVVYPPPTLCNTCSEHARSIDSECYCSCHKVKT